MSDSADASPPPSPAPHAPFVPAATVMPDFNLKSITLGIVLGALFGSANAYLGLRVGLTISTAIPLAVMSVAILRALAPVLGRSTILECNISQTAGSASSSLASGLIFTIPALFIWGFAPSLAQMTLLAVSGGVLGILFMIPLRSYLIVRGHGTLPYPEGTASAEVLVAASEGGAGARGVFQGLGLGALYKGVTSLVSLWPTTVEIGVPFVKKALIGISTTPALLGVGYILGRRVGAIMVGGGLLSWVVIIPFIAWRYGDLEIAAHTLTYLRSRGLASDVSLIGELSPHQLWDGYIRIIGAGAVACAGLLTVARAVPTMVGALRAGLRELGASARMLDAGRLRTERDLSIRYVLAGVIAVVALLTVVPGVLGGSTTAAMRLVAALAVAVFAFCFVTVSSRIVGMIGVSSNPTSGMAIVTLLGTGLVFHVVGWTDLSGKVAALTVGTVVCVAASIAGDISQDLKTGFLIGAEPRKQQIGELMGAIGAAFFVSLAVFYLGQAYGFGSNALPAPQAMLMKTVLDGVLDGNLRWDLVGVGALFALAVLPFRIGPLPFAVGMYLPLDSMTPLFIGGVLRHVVDSRRAAAASAADTAQEKGVLLSSGLIAGEGLMGVVVAAIAVAFSKVPTFFEISYPVPWLGSLVSLVVFGALGWLLFRAGRGSEAL